MSSEYVQSLKALHECQKEKKTKSCYPCNEMVECETRKNYVKQTYLSMNPDMEDNTKGFEF